MQSLLKSIPQFLLNSAVPPMCGVCGRATHDAQKLCAQCWRGLAHIAAPICDVLGTPLPIEFARVGEAYVSLQAQTNPPEWGRARAAMVYMGVARQVVHRFKFSDGLPLGPFMAQEMLRAGAEVLSETDVLIPVPLHWSRLIKRQYNQAAILAKRIGELAEIEVLPFALKRKRYTRQQVGLTRAQRARNVENAFVLSSEAAEFLKGKRVVLVDDVLTTGATLNELARVLKKARVKSIDVLVFATVVPDMYEDGL